MDSGIRFAVAISPRRLSDSQSDSSTRPLVQYQIYELAPAANQSEADDGAAGNDTTGNNDKGGGCEVWCRELLRVFRGRERQFHAVIAPGVEENVGLFAVDGDIGGRIRRYGIRGGGGQILCFGILLLRLRW